MGMKEKLLKAGGELRRRLENAFGRGTANKTSDIRREILEQVKSGTSAGQGAKIFPYEKLSLQLKPVTAALHEAFKRSFLEGDSLKADIRRTLADAQAVHPDAFQIVVKLLPAPRVQEPGSAAHSMFQLEFVRIHPMPGREIPEAKLAIARGIAERPEYRTKGGRLLIGSLHEVLDREGRVVRRNDLVFIDNGDEINSTVGRVHARIWFDPETQEFYVMDEISHYGTRIVRNGRSIEVPSGNLRGIPLRSGDEIFFGQASLRFELPPP